MSEFTTICTVTISVVILKVKRESKSIHKIVQLLFYPPPKLFIGVCVLGIFTGHCKSSTWSVAFSLAQVSEFSFVLASRARQLRIISREVCAILTTYTHHTDDHYHIFSPLLGVLGDSKHSNNESPPCASAMENISTPFPTSPWLSLLSLSLSQQVTS